MIRLTYTHICDLCKKHIDSEVYECASYLLGVFPRPHNHYTYQIGYTAEMCNDCAAPIMQARDEAIEKWKHEQAAQQERKL
jgi:hypothetical protein